MWKPAGVLGLWLVLIAVPHVRSQAVNVAPTGTELAVNVPVDDPGDPFLEGEDARRKAELPSAFATIRFKNKLDKTLTLVSATLVMDGAPLTAVTNLAPQSENVLFTGPVAPGPHVVTTRLTVLGRRRGGVFTYTKGYRWQVTSEQTLNALPKRSIVFTISAVRRKGMNVPLEKQVEVSVYNELLPEPVSQGS
jgi:hypothetical protein